MAGEAKGEAPQLEWRIIARAEPLLPGFGRVHVDAQNAFISHLSFAVPIDWPAGQEAADVEARVLLLLRRLFAQLSVSCAEKAKGRMAYGESD